MSSVPSRACRRRGAGIYPPVSAKYSSAGLVASGGSHQKCDDVMACAKILLNTDVNIG
jgi:hypothetical protein